VVNATELLAMMNMIYNARMDHATMFLMTQTTREPSAMIAASGLFYFAQLSEESSFWLQV
jgi:hypothetical protein